MSRSAAGHFYFDGFCLRLLGFLAVFADGGTYFFCSPSSASDKSFNHLFNLDFAIVRMCERACEVLIKVSQSGSGAFRFLSTMISQ